MTLRLPIIISFIVSVLYVNTWSQYMVARSAAYSSQSTVDTLKILALMVEFQSDNDKTTYGTGKFSSIYTKDYGRKILDPLPHDSAYFAAHLEFVKNYFTKNSGGKLTIEFTVLPQIVTVSQTMRNYSPPIKSTDFKPIVDFSRESWQKADSAHPAFDFGKYNTFIIFHAGVGRDISVPGSLGNERDIPSIFMGLELYKQYYGAAFAGIPIKNGTQFITNTAVIPQTQNREVETLTGSALYEITINGLLAATIGSRLGLPDLFNTETGLSAIGRFGLMDGQSIFAYNGLYPPELSAWEKIYLGWRTPIELNGSNGSVTLTTGEVSALSDTVILKIPINENEYYLIENRQRDAKRDGSKLKIKDGGSVYTKQFNGDVDGYLSYSTDSVDGVVTDIDEFDWSLPGNGVLIWHINEKVIKDKIASNKVNTDKNNRGVDLEEADGIQDIGEQFTTIFGDIITAEGNEEDFWYANNPASLYKNNFDADSRPNTASSSGAASLITIKHFTSNANRISFFYKLGNDRLTPVVSKRIFNNSAQLTFAPVRYPGKEYFQVIADSNFYLTDAQGNISFSKTGFTSFQAASIASQIGMQDIFYLLGSVKDQIGLLTYNSGVIGESVFRAPSTVSSPLVLQISSTEAPKVLIGTEGRVYRFQILGTTSPTLNMVDSITLGTNDSVMQIAASESYYCFTYSEPNTSFFYWKDNIGNTFKLDGAFRKLALYYIPGSDYRACILHGNSMISVIEKGKLISNFQLRTNSVVSDFYLSPLRDDSKIYIIYGDGQKFYAMSPNGSVADNFPYADDTGLKIDNASLSASFFDGKGSDLLFMKNERDLDGVNGITGETSYSFPITFNNNLILKTVISTSFTGKSLALVDGAGNFKSYKIEEAYPGAVKVYWTGKFADAQNSSFIKTTTAPNASNVFMPENAVYNYPNPVYSGYTYIRYLVNEDSRIKIKIFDLAGDLVKEFDATAGANYESETAWNITDVQSGVYFANITATGASGKTANKIIKIAVIK